MAKKKKAEQPRREFTRRQLSQFKRQKRRQRIIFSSGIFIIAAVILIVLVGWYIGVYRPLHQTVIKVYDTEFNMGYYIDALRSSSEGQSAEYVEMLADIVVVQIQEKEIIRRGALELGISVSDDEVREALKNSDLSVNDAVLDSVRTQLLGNKLYTEYFDSRVPVSAEQVHIMAMLLESETQALEIRDRLQNSDNFSALAGEYSLDLTTKTNEGDLGWHPQSILAAMLSSPVPGEYAFGSEVGTLSQPRYDGEVVKRLGYWLIRVLEKEEGDVSAQVQAILLGSEKEAQDVRARLEAGEDLATLAEELSQNEETRKQKGEMGVVEQGEISTAFDEYVFNPEVEVGVLSEPIRDETVGTSGGYWLIEVLDKDNDRKLGDEDRNHLLDEAFEEWLSILKVSAVDNVASYLDSESKAWAIEQVTKGQSQT